MKRFIHTYKTKSVWNNKNKHYTQIKYMTNILININNINIIEDNSVKYDTNDAFVTVYTNINWLKVIFFLILQFILAGSIWLFTLLPIVPIEKVLWIFICFSILVIAVPSICSILSPSLLSWRDKYIVAREDIQELEVE